MNNSKISRPNIYILILTIVLFIVVLLFSNLALIPKGKEYREQRVELQKDNMDLRRYQNFHDATADILSQLKNENNDIINAFDNEFEPQKFQEQYKSYFNTLSLSKKVEVSKEDSFVTYEVSTTSQMNSPKSFYDFLDAVNNSDWIIAVDFPINFKRENEVIHSSFSMKVYNIDKDGFKKPKDTNESSTN